MRHVRPHQPSPAIARLEDPRIRILDSIQRAQFHERARPTACEPQQRRQQEDVFAVLGVGGMRRLKARECAACCGVAARRVVVVANSRQHIDDARDEVGRRR